MTSNVRALKDAILRAEITSYQRRQREAGLDGEDEDALAKLLREEKRRLIQTNIDRQKRRPEDFYRRLR